ncbi:acetyl-CoA C-acetyltransferase [Phenylobacterium sp.]|uniref:acetyl-CoA C-acetyltransferase n=1 Tax=Phenylobacterium sp. TaxID=1871053 RepID=UPI0025F1924B|nr:acetyl-CoA C-acetyltransferase [Phenylobacterium sp.]MBX3485512.1 acetyl-CoA C-acetyltransferase [Phenylobacterium sp.]MCW5760235.1 acetyl-CoA C-acetyltransferase [Phenylobacterium sp.]
MAEAYIVAATRTAGGRKGGRLRDWHPSDLAGKVLDDLVARTGIDPAVIEDVIMGCVTQAGEQSTNIARNAVLSSSLPESVPATSVDRQCGSSQQALQFAAQAVMSGTQDVVIASGVESMTRCAMGMAVILPAKAGLGVPKSPKQEERYPNIQFSQFAGAEMVAKKYGLTKDQLDEYGYRSHQNAIAATQAGAFKDEILVLDGKDAEGNTVRHEADEGIRFEASLEAMKNVKLLQEGGAITAATSSQICDGASGVMVVSEKALKEHNLTPMARVHHLSVMGHDPVIMLEAPIPATERALKRAGLSIDDIDLFEVNEAFASVPVAFLQKTGADPDRLNVNGGAIALGHPLGASGTKLMTTLLYALKARGKKYGLQTMCEGGGLANVTIVERL